MGKGSEEGHKSDLLPIKLSEMLKELYLLMLFKGSKCVKVIYKNPYKKKISRILLLPTPGVKNMLLSRIWINSCCK